MTEHRRLFFALWPDEATRLRIGQWCKHSGIRAGVPTPAGNLHITLCFLGSVEATLQPVIEQAVETISVPPEFCLLLDQSGYWPKPRVLWLGCQQSPAPLLALAEALRLSMLRLGLTPDARSYVPHLTVMRKIPAPAVLPSVPEPMVWHARDFVLAWSRSADMGVEYHVLKRWQLTSAAFDN